MSRERADATPPSVLFACAAQHAFIDHSGRLCLIGIVRELYVPSVPHTIERLCLGLEIAGTGPPPHRSKHLALRFIDGRAGNAVRDHRQLSIEERWPRLAVTVRDLTVARDGKHRFEIFIGAVPAGVLDLPVILASPANSAVH